LSSKYKNAVMSNLAKKSHKPSSRRAKRKGGRPLAERCSADESRPSESSRPESVVSTPTPVSTTSTPTSPKFGTQQPQLITRDPRERYVEGMDLWFIPPSNPVMHALYQFCIEKEVCWHVAVLRFLRKGLMEEGYLDEEEAEQHK